MDLRDVIVATMTWVRSEAEEPLLRRALNALSTLGVPIVVADRPARESFCRVLTELPAVEVCRATDDGLCHQIAAAVDRAARHDSRFVLYTEPDKEIFFREHLVDFVRKAPDGADVGIVLASRSREGFATFPRIQRYTETVINDLCREAIGAGGDYTYGPFLLARALIPAVVELDRSLGWGWRPLIFRRAASRGLRLCRVEGDYRCPSDQSADDDAERTHRLSQLIQNIRGLIA